MPRRAGVKQKRFYKPGYARTKPTRMFYGAPPRRALLSYVPSPEKKAADFSGTPAVDTTGSIVTLNGIARGDSISERIGRKVQMRSVHIRGHMQSTTTTGTAQMGRVLLVYDRQTNGAVPGITDVLDAIGSTSHRNLSTTMRFRVLMDRLYPLPDQTGDGEHLQLPVNEYMKINLPVHFNNGDAGTVADITTGGLYLITLGDNAAGVTAGTFAVKTRVRYTDV